MSFSVLYAKPAACIAFQAVLVLCYSQIQMLRTLSISTPILAGLSVTMTPALESASTLSEAAPEIY